MARSVRARTQDVFVRGLDLVHYVINRGSQKNRPDNSITREKS